MLADFLAWVLRFAPWAFLAGLCFLLAGLVGVMVFRRREVTIGPDPVIPPVRQPGPFRVPSPPAPANYHRPDADTHVIPGIPGATPPLSPQLRAVARYLDAQAADDTVPLTPIAGLREERIEAGPVCATCGGPFGACTCNIRASEQTQVVDLCPLTTQDLVIPTYGDTPVHREIADREPTQELSGPVAKILEATK